MQLPPSVLRTLDYVSTLRSFYVCPWYTRESARLILLPTRRSKGPAAAGQLIFLCGGDKDLFDAAAKDLDLMGKVCARLSFGEREGLTMICSSLSGARSGFPLCV